MIGYKKSSLFLRRKPRRPTMATTDYHSWKQDQLCFTMAPLKSVWGQCFEGMPVSHEQLFKLLKLSGQQLFLVVCVSAPSTDGSPAC